MSIVKSSKMLMVLVATICGVLTCSAGSLEWEDLSAGHANWINATTVDQNGNFYLALDLGGFFKSTDGGNNYTVSNSGIKNYHLQEIVVSPANSNIIFAGSVGGFYRSGDGGKTWQETLLDDLSASSKAFTAPIGSIAINPNNSNEIFIAVGALRCESNLTHNYWINTEPTNKGAIFKSTNNGYTWTRINPSTTRNLPANEIIHDLIIDKNSPNILYAATTNGVYKSTNSGVNWTKKSKNLPDGKTAQSLLINPDNSSILYTTIHNGYPWKSTDSGDNWTEIKTGLGTTLPNYNWLAYDDTNNILYVAGSTYRSNSTGIFKSIDGGDNWTQLTEWNNPNGNMTHGWYGTQANATTVSLDPNNPNIIYMGCSTTVYKSTDRGATWQQIYTVDNQDGTFSSRGLICNGGAHSFVVNPLNKNIMLMDSGDHGVLRSTDGGISWSKTAKNSNLATTDGLKYNSHIYDMVVDSANNTLFISDSQRSDTNKGRIGISTDFGATWHSYPLPINKTIMSIVIDSTSPVGNRTLYAACNKSGVYRSTNNGITWTAINNGLPDGANSYVQRLIESPATPGDIYAGVWRNTTAGGLYKLTKGTNSWIKVNRNSANQVFLTDLLDPIKNWNNRQFNADTVLQRVSDVAIDPEDANIIYISTKKYSANAGVWKTTDGGIHWKLIFKDMKESATVRISPTNSSCIYTASKINNEGDISSGEGLWVSKDKGENWEKITGLPWDRFERIYFDPISPERLYVGAIGCAYFTASQLVGYWTMDEANGTIFDHSGYSHNMSLHNGVSRSDGLLSQALNFDGLDDYASVYGIPLSASNGFAISAWVKRNGNQDIYDCLVGGNRCSLRMFTANKIQFTLFNSTNNYKSIQTSTAIPNAEWTHIVATYNYSEDRMTIYINGAEATSANNIGFLTSGFSSYVKFHQIGGRSQGDRIFKGQIDNIRIYQCDFDANDIATLYKHEILVGKWCFEESTGTKALDLSKYRNQMSLHGGAPHNLNGKQGSSLILTGSNYGDVYNIKLSADSGFTIATWVKRVGNQSTYDCLVCGNTCSLRMFAGNKIQFTLFDSNDNYKAIQTSIAIPDNEWCHVAATYSHANDQMTIFINGVEAASGNNIGGLSPAFNNNLKFHQIGGRSQGDRMFEGEMDNIQIYKKALSAAQIVKLME